MVSLGHSGPRDVSEASWVEWNLPSGVDQWRVGLCRYQLKTNICKIIVDRVIVWCIVYATATGEPESLNSTERVESLKITA